MARFVRNGQFFATFSAAGSQYATTVVRGHAAAEAVLIAPLAVGRLVSSLHDSLLLRLQI